jgi:Outer membrane lipoprotein-sorting protein
MKRLRLFAIVFSASLPVIAQESKTQLALVRKLDAINQPPSSFSATLIVRRIKTNTGEVLPSELIQDSRRRVEPDGRIVFDTLIRCTAPPKDDGKALLFVDDTCWFCAPHARNASKLSSGQVASQALLADVLNWRFADDFDHTMAGGGQIEVAGKTHSCVVLDFAPKPGVKTRRPLLRFWLDSEGRPWKAEQYASSGRLFQTVQYQEYAEHLGAPRPVQLTVTQQLNVEEITIRDFRAASPPDEYFQPERLPALKVEK